MGQGVRFTRPDTWLAAAPQPVDPQAALAAAARRFLAAYGPATYHDLARWWVDQAVRLAAVQGRKIEAADLRQALSEMGGKDRPLIQSVQWEDLVVEEDVERDLRTLGALA